MKVSRLLLSLAAASILASGAQGLARADEKQETKTQPQFVLIAQRVPVVAEGQADPATVSAVAAAQTLTASDSAGGQNKAGDADRPCDQSQAAAAPLKLDTGNGLLETRVIALNGKELESGKALETGKELGALSWPKTSHDAGWTDYAIIGGSVAGALGAEFLIHPPDRHWGHNAFDEGARDLLRLKNPADRTKIRTIGDYIFYGSIGIPVIEGLAMLPRDKKVAWNYMVMSAETLALLAPFNLVVERTAGRERPYVRDCQPGSTVNNPDCKTGGGLVHSLEGYDNSFFSGHTSTTTASVTMSCLMHWRHAIYNNKALDLTQCVVLQAAALFDGATRIMSDHHYTSDVLTGYGVGLGSAFLMDYLWNGPLGSYGESRAGSIVKNHDLKLTPTKEKDYSGLVLSGRW